LEKASSRFTGDFADVTQEWKRMLAEFIGTFGLVLGSAGGTVVAKSFGQPVDIITGCFSGGLMLMALIYALADVSGAHFNPAVTIAFALRKDFPWYRVPGYVFAQIAGATLAAAIFLLLFGPSSGLGVVYPANGVSDMASLCVETILTMLLIITVLGTASGARIVGHNAAIAVSSFIIAANLFGGSLTGAAMNPARVIGPDIVAGNFNSCWIYIIGSLLGAVIAVLLARALRGKGNEAEKAAALGRTEKTADKNSF
jgi:aquaporin Z